METAVDRILEGKVALVIGGGSSNADGGQSNGQAAALTFARSGARVVVVDRNHDAAEETAHLIHGENGTAIAEYGDVLDPNSIDKAVKKAASTFGHIDILHNNVGIESPGDIMETSLEEWDRVHDVNLRGVFATCKITIPYLRAAGGGSIINISSTASMRASPAKFISYSTSKAGLNHMSRIMAKDLAHENIRVNVVVPGMMDTPHIRTFFAHLSPEELAQKLRERDAACPMGRQGTCWDVANAALFLASPLSSYVTGTLLMVDGGLTI